MASDEVKARIKPERTDWEPNTNPNHVPSSANASQVIDLSSDSENSMLDSSSEDEASSPKRKRSRVSDRAMDVVLPGGFLDPLPISRQPVMPSSSQPAPLRVVEAVSSGSKQFWKAGDYEVSSGGDWGLTDGGMDHVRVHPRFLHSNATSHKWVLGAFAELLDNSLDEVCNGATYVNIDMLRSNKDGSKILLIEDNGGGMDPEKMRHCMSLGYSAKSKMVDTIGQYGNGFKTSTMRLGADVIVFSRSQGKNGKSPTQSIGLLSYSFLRDTGKEDIVVPMVDYERKGGIWNKIIRSSANDWERNVETMVQWSPFSSDSELLQQFSQMNDQGTRIIIYNLWEDDQGLLELDFDSDPHDITIRGVNRDPKNIEMANKYPNSKHFLTYRHSLRNYAAILYLRIPDGFRIILRGKDVEHHNIINDMMMSQEITYRPHSGAEGVPKDCNMVAVVTIGFVKDAKDHIDVQGFNVYHRNRLIKPFWRLWHAPGSDGRGVIGVLEANFIEPAHDKQGFERTTVLARLESRLIQMQKTYWSTNCHKIGYAPRRNKRAHERDSKTQSKSSNKRHVSGDLNSKGFVRTPRERTSYDERSSSSSEDQQVGDAQMQLVVSRSEPNGSSSKETTYDRSKKRSTQSRLEHGTVTPVEPVDAKRNLKSRENGLNGGKSSASRDSCMICPRLREKNRRMRERLEKEEHETLSELLNELLSEKEKCKALEAELQQAKLKFAELQKDQMNVVETMSEERQRHSVEEEKLRVQIQAASSTMEDLLNKLKDLEKKKNGGM